ncbi:polysaccharide deacetylase family protein [Paenibacillus sp. NPDC058071]|uniref:polysaccharide deacetylase family protein n=1 Tax=Paenibacillus sp. NPDC058071 TaxID=3346326 RepID=UPI0036DF7ECA
MFILRSPMSRKPEREYIYRVVLQQFLGFDYAVEYEERNDIVIVWRDDDARRLTLADVFLATADADWLQRSSLPKRPLMRTGTGQGGEELPVLYGRVLAGEGYFGGEQNSRYIGIDVFGSSFFMLTRYEELVIRERDDHGRFGAEQSIAWQERFLHRPIVNEYVACLEQAMRQLWPGLPVKRRDMQRHISHDVDFPFYAYGKNAWAIAKESLGDIVRRRSPETAMKKLSMMYRGHSRLGADPYNRFSYLMDLSERIGIRSSFYFITEATRPGMDGNYAMDDANIHALMKEIHARGHEIGLHPSYDTYKNPESIGRQFGLLRQTAESLGIHQEHWGGRQHYLRWSAEETWQHWEDAGLHYDSTVGYADVAGFRCGVCYEYPVFNVRERKPLQLLERPLIVMDQTLLHYEYMGLQAEEALRVLTDYSNQCRKYNGDFTLLWHNSQLVKASDRTVYESYMKQLSGQ